MHTNLSAGTRFTVNGLTFTPAGYNRVEVSEDDPGTEYPLDETTALWFLNLDGGALTYSELGRTTADCAPFAYVLAMILAAQNGDAPDYRTLNEAMSTVVNAPWDAAELLSDYATEYGWNFAPAEDDYGYATIFKLNDETADRLV
jgi:hypothetical protein